MVESCHWLTPLRSSLQDIACGELAGSALDAFRTLMNDLYLPILREQDQAWGVAPEDAAGDFLQGSARLVSVLGEAANSLLGGVELRKCDKRFGGDTEEPTPALCSKLAADSEALQHFDAVLADWCTQTDRLIQDSDNVRREPDDAGPNTELSFWRDRMAKLNSVLEQLKGRGARLVLETCILANTPSVSTWRAVEGRRVLRLQQTHSRAFDSRGRTLFLQNDRGHQRDEGQCQVSDNAREVFRAAVQRHPCSHP